MHPEQLASKSWGYAALHGRRKRRCSPAPAASSTAGKHSDRGAHEDDANNECDAIDAKKHSCAHDAQRTKRIDAKNANSGVKAALPECTASTDTLLQKYCTFGPKTRLRRHNKSVELHDALEQDLRCLDIRKARISCVNKQIGPSLASAYRIHNATSIKTLLLSHNCIQSLHGIENFNKLEQLSLASNNIEDMHEVQRVGSACTHLRAIALQGNPVCSQLAFRERVIAMMPQSLCEINGIAISKHERARAHSTVRTDERMIESALSNGHKILLLEHACKLVRVHQQLRCVFHHTPVQQEQNDGERLTASTVNASILLRAVSEQDAKSEDFERDLVRAFRRELGQICRQAEWQQKHLYIQARDVAYSTFLQSQQSLIARLTAELDSMLIDEAPQDQASRFRLRRVSASPDQLHFKANEKSAMPQQREQALIVRHDTAMEPHARHEPFNPSVRSNDSGWSQQHQESTNERDHKKQLREEETAFDQPELEVELERAVTKLEELEQENNELRNANEALSAAVAEREEWRKRVTEELEAHQADMQRRIAAAEAKAEREQEAIEARWQRAFEELSDENEGKERLAQQLRDVTAERDRINNEYQLSRSRLAQLQKLEQRRETAESMGDRWLIRMTFWKLQLNIRNAHKERRAEAEMEGTLNSVTDSIADSHYASLMRSWQALAYLHTRGRDARKHSLRQQYHGMLECWQYAYTRRQSYVGYINYLNVLALGKVLRAWRAQTYAALQGKRAKLSLILLAWSRRSKRRHRLLDRKLHWCKQKVRRKVRRLELAVTRKHSAERWAFAKRREQLRQTISHWRKTSEQAAYSHAMSKTTEMAKELASARELAEACRKKHKENRLEQIPSF